MLEHLPHLEYLNLSGLTLNVGKGIPFLPNLQELKLHYKSYQSDTGLLTNDLPDLHTLKLRAEEAINIGMNFPNLPKLRNLFIEAPTINTLEGLSICTNLEEIYLINLDIESLPKWFSNFKKVTWFYIEFLRKLRILDLDFSKLQHLQFLNLRGLDSLNFIDDSLVQCIRLERLSISYLKSLKSLPDLGGPNHALKELDINTCPIESLPLKMKELKNLEQLYIVATKLTSIPTFILQFEKLIKLSIGHTPTLTEIPNGMGGLPNLKNISFFKNIKFNTYPGYSLENTDVSTRALIFDWIIRKDKAFPLSKAVALAILKVINLDIKPFNKTLFADLHLLNFNKRPIDAKAISNGGKVFVSGRIVGNKTTLKEQLKELGLTLVNKLTDDVPFILLGKKLKLVEELYNGKRIFFTQLDLKHLKKEVNPGMLEQEQTPPEFVDKLDQLIWSKDIPNQLLAFEMVKQHGLPKPLEKREI